MTFRDGEVAGVSVRVARVSFTGELSYEILVDGRRGLELWEAVTTAGAPFGLTPYGTEAMHVLRAEKGFVIVGQDTDGTVTPDDLGMGWIIRKDDSDFIGRRSLRRADTRSRGPEAAGGAELERAAARRRTTRRRGHRPDPDADDRPRHIVVRQPVARQAYRARDGRAGTVAARPDRSTRRCRAARSPRRSCRPSSTTPREPVVTAENLVAVDLAQVALRADPTVLPFEAPGSNTATKWSGRDVLWLGPDEWLVVDEPGTEVAMERELREALDGGGHHSVVDVGANRTVFDLTGGLEAPLDRVRPGSPPHPLATWHVRPNPLRPSPGDPPPARRANDARLRPPVIRRLLRRQTRSNEAAHLSPASIRSCHVTVAATWLNVKRWRARTSVSGSASVGPSERSRRSGVNDLRKRRRRS